jgi:hypothetical protein
MELVITFTHGFAADTADTKKYVTNVAISAGDRQP